MGSHWICGIKRMRIADAEPEMLTFSSIFFFSFSSFLWSRSPLEQGDGDESLEVNSPRFLFGSRPNGNVSIFRPRCATTIRLIEMYLSSKWDSMQRDGSKEETQYRFRPAKGIQFRFVNFAFHFIFVEDKMNISQSVRKKGTS